MDFCTCKNGNVPAAPVLAMVQDEDDMIAAALTAAIAEHKKKMEPMALPHHFF